MAKEPIWTSQEKAKIVRRGLQGRKVAELCTGRRQWSWVEELAPAIDEFVEYFKVNY